MGSPAMNFIDAEVVQENGTVKLQFGQEKITVPEGQANTLVDSGYVGKKVVMGIRPGCTRIYSRCTICTCYFKIQEYFCTKQLV